MKVNTLLCAIALGQLHSASVLALGTAQVPPSNARRKARLSDSDLMAAGRDADEEDDFDTWFFAHATEGPEKRPPSKEEIGAVVEAQLGCGLRDAGRPGIENGVITYLVTRPFDHIRLLESLPRLRYYFLQHRPYPLKVFIPSDSLRRYDPTSYGDSPTYDQVLSALQSNMQEGYDYEVATFDLKLPDIIEKDSSWKSKMNGCAQAVETSYKHMNQFFTKAMYEHPSLQKYRYYLRLDADFNFKATLQQDPFCMMAKTGRKFMWQTRKTIQDPSCSDGLWEWFEHYQQTHGLTPADPILFKPKGARVNYVGYAGMGDLDFFRSKPVRKLAEALNRDGRVYLNRWSDQTYYPLLFGLFANHSAVGDIGFGWPEKSWVHKGWIPPQKFNPVTGKIR